jgi:hypothetical protein
MTRRRLGIVTILALLCLGVVAASAQAACDTWEDTSGGTWSEASHWSAGVPGSGTEVCITKPGTYTVTLEPYAGGGGDSVKSLTIGTPGGTGTQTLHIAGQSWIYEGEQQNHVALGIESPGVATVAASGELALDATALNTYGKTSGEDEPGGDAVLGGTLVNRGTVRSQVEDSTWHTTLEGTVTNEAGGKMLLVSGTLKADAENTINKGLVTIDSGATLLMQPGFSSDNFLNSGSVENSGLVDLIGGGASWTQSGSETGDAVVLQRGATLTDASGPGQFLFDSGGGTLTGTIASGQTVTVQGESFVENGETQNQTTLGFANTKILNDGTLVLDSTNGGGHSGSEAPGGSVNLVSGAIENEGTIRAEGESSTRGTRLEAGLTNAGRLELVSDELLANGGGAATANSGFVAIAPGASFVLTEAAAFVNTGTLAPQIASASSFGLVRFQGGCCSGPGVLTAGGTLAPTLVGGYTPPSGQEIELFPTGGGSFVGTFGAVTNGFSADYSHETAETPYVGVIYGAGPGGGSKPAPGTPAAPVVHLVSVAGGKGKLTVTLSCPAGGAACATAAVTVTITEHLKGTRLTAISAGKPKKRTKKVTIAAASVTLAAGATKKLTLSLSSSARKLLAHYGPLAALVEVRSAGKLLAEHGVRVAKVKRK